MKEKNFSNNDLAHLVNKLDHKVDGLAELLSINQQAILGNKQAIISNRREIRSNRQEIKELRQEVKKDIEDLAIMTAQEFERQNNNLENLRVEVKTVVTNHEIRITKLEGVGTT